MRKTLILFVTFLILRQMAFANDGVFYSNGNTLMPMQETQVELRKEVLKFFVVNHQFAKIDVHFEFYNPGEEKSITVGFVTPPANGDVSDEEAKYSFIQDFTVNVNGKVIPSKLKRLKETTFTLERKEDESSKEDYFVYYFPVTFKKGINIIRHTYRYKGGNSVELSRDFEYQITTGKLWANKQIDDFELQIHLDNGIFAIPARFNKPNFDAALQPSRDLADWKIVGEGTIAEGTRQWFGEGSQVVRMAHLNSGYLSFKEKNFKPDFDIAFGEYQWGSGWEDIWCNFGQECLEPESLKKVVHSFYLDRSELDEDMIRDLTKKEKQYAYNYSYAVRGYYFKDKQIRDFYSQFFWYKPNKRLKLADMKLSRNEAKYLERFRRFTKM